MQVLIAKERQGRVDLRDLMRKLGEQKIDGILLEGGGTLNQNALESGIVNHVQAYLAPKIFGGSGRYTPVSGIGPKSRMGLIFWKIRRYSVLAGIFCWNMM